MSARYLEAWEYTVNYRTHRQHEEQSVGHDQSAQNKH